MCATDANEDDNRNDLWNYDELYSRIDNMQRQESLLQETVNSTLIMNVPVICWDALLPRQRLEGRTTDETFGRFLQHIGIGGIFGMVSLNHKERKLRRDGVLCKVEVVDAPSSIGGDIVRNDDERPFFLTAVDFSLVGLQPCQVVTAGGGGERYASSCRSLATKL